MEMVRGGSVDRLKWQAQDFIAQGERDGSTNNGSVCFSVSKQPITRLDMEFGEGKAVWTRRRSVANLNVLVATHIYPKIAICHFDIYQRCPHRLSLRLGHQTTKFMSCTLFVLEPQRLLNPSFIPLKLVCGSKFGTVTAF